MLTGALKSLFAVAEAYPDLKANQNFLMLQEELSGTEDQDRLRAAVLQRHRDELQHEIQQFPTVFLANVFNFENGASCSTAAPEDTEPGPGAVLGPAVGAAAR